MQVVCDRANAGQDMERQELYMNLMNRCPGCRRSQCEGCGIYRKLNTNKHSRISLPEAFVLEPEEGLGISFDVGTTTMAGMLWNLENGALLNAETAANPQAVFGADVVSRIQAAVLHREQLKEMQRMVIERLDQMAAAMMETENEVEKGIGKVTIAGNTAMCEILLGILPEGLFRAPFTPDYHEIIRLKGRELGFAFLQKADIIVLPPIGGYVGSDALMVHSYVSLERRTQNILSVDIGTNGEILLQYMGNKYACSTAAGPALEGGAVSQGMRASEGAIGMVSLAGRFPLQDIAVRAIGGGKARGICGSGLVDGLSVLYEVGVLEHTGYMRSALEARKVGTPERICKRIEEEAGERRFLLTDSSNPVYLTAGDVRQLQMSIGAIRAGMETLLTKAGCEVGQLDAFYLAGAFGCYISVESAVSIGLLPDMDREKIVQAGNLAGAGAAMALLSSKIQEWMDQEKDQIIHVELAAESGFQELFLEHMNFPLQF